MKNYVHPTAIVGQNVNMGSGNTIGPNVVIVGSVTIGNSNWFGPSVVIGTPAEIRGEELGTPWEQKVDSESEYGVSIGSNNVFREFTSVHSGSLRETVVQDSCYMLRNSHVAHDCFIGSYVTMSCNATLGGHAEVAPFVNLGINSAVHQKSKLGAGSMVGMGSVIRNDVAPFSLTIGNPARVIGFNERAVERFNARDLLEELGSKITNSALLSLPEMRSFIESWNRLVASQ